jgi:septum formation protein
MIVLPKPLVLASASPRRQSLLRALGLPFQVLASHCDESFPESTPADEVPGLLALRKAREVWAQVPEALVLAADTVVHLEGQILNKPADAAEARYMLQSLSGKSHQVFTGYCLLETGREVHRVDTAQVQFRTLLPAEIDWYIQNHPPYDKAGAYGIQEWIGMVGCQRIEGSYFTVMGLPTHRIWQDLLEWYPVPKG